MFFSYCSITIYFSLVDFLLHLINALYVNLRLLIYYYLCNSDTASKKTPSPSSATPILGSGSGDKKSGNHSILSSLKRLVGDSGSNNGNGSVNMGLEEELDGVERGEGLPLSHLTASRAKAPRRRPPTTQHLRHTAASSTTSVVSSNSANFLTVFKI